MTITAGVHLLFRVPFSRDIVSVTFDIFSLTLFRNLFVSCPTNIANFSMILRLSVPEL